MSHTPAPWRAHKSFAVFANQSKLITRVNTIMAQSEAKANAALIAAAPDLLETLQAVERFFESRAPECAARLGVGYHRMRRSVQTAIEKATKP